MDSRVRVFGLMKDTLGSWEMILDLRNDETVEWPGTMMQSSSSCCQSMIKLGRSMPRISWDERPRRRTEKR